MTTFEKCKLIRRVIVNRAAEVMAYTNWSDDFCAKQLREIPSDLLSQKPELDQIQPSELTNEQCDDLGFGRWSDSSSLRLIPLWLLPFLASDIKTTCIDGKEIFKKSEMDNDHRFGCIAYGITPR